MLRILRPGPQTLVQDLGRYGWQSHGFSSGGAVDSLAHRLANALVGNAANAATLEFMVLGGQCFFDHNATIAITGAAQTFTVDDKAPIAAWTACAIKAGSTVTLGKFDGMYSYMAVSGGIDTPRVMGSRSTDLVAGIGGHWGRALRAGDELPLKQSAANNAFAVSIHTPGYFTDRESPIRIIPGPRRHALSDEDWDRFVHGDWTIRPDSNRMGIRLQSTVPFSPPALGAHLSEGTIPGAIQLTPGGIPMVLLPARGTLGGYPIIATVIAADMPRLAHFKPGRPLHFEVVTEDQARHLLDEQQNFISHQRR